MNKTIVTTLAILIVMAAVVKKGESYLRMGRGMFYNNIEKPRGIPMPPPPGHHYYNNAEVRRTARLGSKRGSHADIRFSLCFLVCLFFFF